MSIDKITDKILSEAREEAQKLLEKAQQESWDVLAKAKEHAEAISKDEEKKAKTDARLLMERKVSVAELEARKLRLAAKQQAIEKCFNQALDRLSNMNQLDYIKLIVKAVKDTGVTDGELILNQRDRDSVGAKVVELVGGSLTLSKDTINAKGGFVLRKGSVEINSTLETMVNAVKEEMTPQVVEILFQ